MAEAAVDQRGSKSGFGPASSPFSAFERLVAWRYLRARR
jgi:lipoprotein-releasing system permease protein